LGSIPALDTQNGADVEGRIVTERSGWCLSRKWADSAALSDSLREHCARAKVLYNLAAIAAC